MGFGRAVKLFAKSLECDLFVKSQRSVVLSEDPLNHNLECESWKTNLYPNLTDLCKSCKLGIGANRH